MKKIKLIIPWILVLLWMILIFYFSAQEAEESLNSSGGFAEFLAKIIHTDFESFTESRQEEIIGDCQFIVRKAAHFSVYAILGMLSFIACKINKLRKSFLISAVICLLYAMSDEIHQHFVEGRSCELRDVLIDFSGGITGIAGIMLIIFIITKFLEKKNQYDL